MKQRQVLQAIPFERLRPSAGWGLQVPYLMLAASLSLLCCQWLAGRQALAPWLVWTCVLSVIVVLAVLQRRFGVARLRNAGSVRRPGPDAILRAWTCSGDLVELVFDDGAWMLLRGDVNEQQWRDVQRLLLWCKRVPSRLAQGLPPQAGASS